MESFCNNYKDYYKNNCSKELICSNFGQDGSNFGADGIGLIDQADITPGFGKEGSGWMSKTSAKGFKPLVLRRRKVDMEETDAPSSHEL